MITILTDDERTAIIQAADSNTEAMSSSEMRLVELTEAAVLAKLAQQEPVAWMCSDPGLSLKGYSRFSPSCEGAWNIPVYTHPAPQQADRQRVPDGVLAAIVRAGFTLVKTANAYELIRFGLAEAQAAAPEAPATAVRQLLADMEAIAAGTAPQGLTVKEFAQHAVADFGRVQPTLPAATEAPAQSNCIQCRNADSWGLPDQPVCKTCTAGSAWTPLNEGSVNPNKPAQARAVDERAAFEAWYSQNAFNFERDPIGSRDCGLQWKAWQARAALAQKGGK